MTATRWKIAGVFVALAVAFGAGVYTGAVRTYADTALAAASSTISSITLSLGGSYAQPPGVDIAQFWQAWNLLQQNFVQTHASTSIPTDKEKLYGAITGLTDSYGDPYTVFMPPAQAQTFQEDISGAFGGVGMELGTKDKQIVVIAPLKNSPAEKAGIKNGDVVLAVDDKSTQGMAVDEAVNVIRGPKGTPVKLLILHQGEMQPVTITIIRDTINIPILNESHRGDGIYVIELYSFSANSTDLFRSALRNFFESGSTKMLLDLRGNPGGYLEAAVQMASYFLPVGDVIVTEDFSGGGGSSLGGKGKQDNIAHRSLGYNVFANKKLSMAILVDQGSASASEILAGALQQHNVAKLIGTRTFGKGSVQQLIDLGGGAELKVTVARWLTPNGTSISDGGLHPDIQASTTQEQFKAGKDPQKDAAVLWLSEQ
jgi:carboxyl-terminal processing protease